MIRKKNLNQLTDDQIRELLRKPLSDENAKQLAELEKADCWLLAHNLSEMSSDGSANMSKNFDDLNREETETDKKG